MIRQYSLAKDGAKLLAPDFKVRELRCKDGSDTVMVDDALMLLLQCIREHFGKAVTITSGYRTPAHNAAVGGAKSSQHLLGRAADIQVAGTSVEDVAAYAESLMPDWGGVGRYPVKAGRATGWVHVDTRADNERVLMPQILEGLRKNEFTFFLQPRYELNARRVIGAEALVRWNHPVLGVISPSVFIPVLESNGYITKLDQYIWEEVCKTIRVWIDEGIRPIPIAVNVTKTDVLAIDVAEFFSDMLKKYRIPPKYLDIDIAKSAYLETHGALSETEAQLQQMGFRVILDGFDGNFVELSALGGIGTDQLKLDLRSAALQDRINTLPGIFAQARTLRLNLMAEGIESTEQLNVLRKAGCAEGQGYIFSRPLSVDEFAKILKVGHSG